MNPMRLRLVVLYGTGGLSDVGRHAVLAALEQPSISNIIVLTQHPELLDEPNWKCGCPEPHSFTQAEKDRFQVVPVTSWKDDSVSDHFQDATAVVSCLGNRQPFVGHWVAHEGNQAVIQAMQKHKVQRVVALTSSGVEEDWP
jgi:nucleoside-diphosphate-sugar epimerase